MSPEVAGMVGLLKTLITVELLAAAVLLIPVITAGILIGAAMVYREASRDD